MATTPVPGGNPEVPIPNMDSANSSAQRIVASQVVDGRMMADLSPGVTQ